MKKNARFTVIAFVAACLLMLGGCPDSSDNDTQIDQRLIGKWSNELAGADEKSFIIDGDGNFTAELTPPAPLNTRGTVKGRLIAEGASYVMSNMTETTSQPWGVALALYNGQLVQIAISGNGESFVMTAVGTDLIGEQINGVFGGTYKKQN